MASTATLLVGLVIAIADGDTLTVLNADKEQVRVRLAEIDAPESGQAHGDRSRQSLIDLCRRANATVRVTDTDRYGRTVGRITCNGVDANAEQVRRGMAWVYDQHVIDQGLYGLQDEARSAGRGLWAERSPVPPWDWRQQQRTAATPSRSTPAATSGEIQLAEKSLVERKQSLVETFPGAPSTGGGSWVHPQVAIHLGQWASGKFAVQVSKWVHDWMTGKGTPYARPLPYHIQRHMMNQSGVPAGYFSILQEMTFMLIAPLEQAGYELPERMVPDISMGKFLCKHLRDQLGVDTDTLPVYSHSYPDGRIVEAKLYPNEYLAEFRRIIQSEWLPKRSAAYFKDRDPASLPYLDRVVMALPGPVSAANAPKFRLRKARGSK